MLLAKARCLHFYGRNMGGTGMNVLAGNGLDFEVLSYLYSVAEP